MISAAAAAAIEKGPTNKKGNLSFHGAAWATIKIVRQRIEKRNEKHELQSKGNGNGNVWYNGNVYNQ
jgi:hypothetical protein